ncbi:MAG TPA: hypothetical protein VEU33_34620 [Archangium sp.]|nr:hypothetical protein [Archangium sp.]
MKHSLVSIALTTLLGLCACVSIVDGPGGMSPSQFDFQPMVPRRKPGPGGWKSAMVIIRLVHVTPQNVEVDVECPIEVQVPEVNHRGVITNLFAQEKAAEAADIASARVLKRGGMTAEMCKRLQEEMQAVMKDPIPGVRVVKAL